MKNGLFLAALAAMTFAACSDSELSNIPPPQDQPVLEDIAVFGPITGFGSVVVNGVHFDTTSTTVSMDDQPGTPSDLRLGMVVSVMGTVDPATGSAAAGEINFVDNAEGPISSIDHAAGTFVVLGQTVFVDELTMFENAEFENLAIGNVVQVSGLWRNQAQILATHVYRVANEYQAGMTMEVKGEIDELDIGNQRFRIGMQTCDFSAAALELGGSDLANGLYVQASSDTPMNGGHMMLSHVQAREQDRNRYENCEAGCVFELVGYVTLIVSDTEFDVDGNPVMTTPDTVYVNGTAESLVLDVLVAVEGTVNVDGVLVAEQIVFRLPSVIEIQADIGAIDTGNAAIAVLGIMVQTNEFTVFRDHTTTGPQTLGFDDLVVGDRVKIRAYVDATSIVASRLDRELPNEVVTLKALVEAVDRPSITMLGVTVTSDQDTVFQNTSHVEIDADEFFALVEISSLVRAEGIYDGAAILANTMFLRECLNACL